MGVGGVWRRLGVEAVAPEVPGPPGRGGCCWLWGEKPGEGGTASEVEPPRRPGRKALKELRRDVCGCGRSGGLPASGGELGLL